MHIHLWDMPVLTDPDKCPPLPYVADRVEMVAVLHSDALVWTGDFSRCMGRIYILKNGRK
jgi:hypothetical protein